MPPTPTETVSTCRWDKFVYGAAVAAGSVATLLGMETFSDQAQAQSTNGSSARFSRKAGIRRSLPQAVAEIRERCREQRIAYGAGALELGVDYGNTSATILRTLLWPVLGRPADVEPVGRSRELAPKDPGTGGRRSPCEGGLRQ